MAADGCFANPLNTSCSSVIYFFFFFSDRGKRISDLNPFITETRVKSPSAASVVPQFPFGGALFHRGKAECTRFISFVSLLPEDGEWAEQCLFVFQLHNG